jgi:hypothetical protein
MSGCEESNSDAVNVAIIRGDTLRLAVDLDAESGDIDVTGWSFLCQLRDAAGGVAATMSTEVLDALKGILQLSLTPGQTGALAPADYAWDLQAQDTAADVRTLVAGKLRVRADVSA